MQYTSNRGGEKVEEKQEEGGWRKTEVAAQRERESVSNQVYNTKEKRGRQQTQTILWGVQKKAKSKEGEIKNQKKARGRDCGKVEKTGRESSQTAKEERK